MDKILRQQARTETGKIEITAVVAKTCDDIIESNFPAKTQQRTEPPRSADITRGKHIASSETTQQHQSCAPRTDTRQLDQCVECIARAHSSNLIFT